MPRIKLLITHKNGDFGAISVTERSAPRRSLKYRDSYRISVHTLPENFLCQQAFTKAITIRLAQTQKETVLYLFCFVFDFVFYQRDRPGYSNHRQAKC